MTNLPFPPIIPEGVTEPRAADEPTVEEPDGERVLDPDANEDEVNSYEADQLASEAD